MESPAKQIRTLGEKGSLAPDSLILKIIEFENLVMEMRKAQVEYFAHRKSSYLQRAKLLESKVDMKLTEFGLLRNPEDSLF